MSKSLTELNAQLIDINIRIEELLQLKEQKEQEIALQKLISDESKYNDYKKTYSYGYLIQKHKLSDYGVWEVYGEDPNCDLGGYHNQPFLGVYEGTLECVIKVAVHLPGFWTWGGGGTIKKYHSPVVQKV